MNEVEEQPYREMVSAQDAAQVDAWAADLFMDFAKRLGVGRAIASFCAVTGLDARGFQRAFLVGGGPDHVAGGVDADDVIRTRSRSWSTSSSPIAR